VVILRAWCWLAIVALLVASGCAKPVSPDFEPIVPGAVYEDLYPNYIQLCALSQIRPLSEAEGGSAGHAVMYLDDMCRVEDAPYPTIKRCEGQTGPDVDRRRGVGISVNKLFKNVNWVAIPDRDLFFDGNMTQSERLTQERYDATLRRATEMGIFRGIEVHDEYLAEKPPDVDLETFIARRSIGTDFALRFGRTVFCARLPATNAMVDHMAAYLNALNAEYATGEAEYEWSGYNDNCAHAIHNTLAAANVWPPKSVGSIKLRQAFNISVPANEFVDLAALANDGPIDDFGKIHGNPAMSESLRESDWLPTRHGALMTAEKIFLDNDLYDTGYNLLLLDSPLLEGKRRKARRMFFDPRYTEIEANLRHFTVLYAEILADQPASKGDTEVMSEREQLRARYYRYIRAQHEDTQQMLRRIGAEDP
jgi:hypothetical protein